MKKHRVSVLTEEENCFKDYNVLADEVKNILPNRHRYMSEEFSDVLNAFLLNSRVPLDKLMSKDRSQDVAEERACIAFVMHYAGFTHEHISSILNRERSSITTAVNKFKVDLGRETVTIKAKEGKITSKYRLAKRLANSISTWNRCVSKTRYYARQMPNKIEI